MSRRSGIDSWRQLLALLLLLAGIQQLAGAGLIKAKAWLAPVLIERAWARSLAGSGQPVKPWPWADTWPVARLIVPAQGIAQFVLAGDSGNALAFGPGHASASATLGDPGLAVIGGHRDTHFAFLRRIQPGARLRLELPDRTLRDYRVETMNVVDASAQSLRQLPGDERLLLVTCYPFDSLRANGPLRYVVTALPEQAVPHVNYLMWTAALRRGPAIIASLANRTNGAMKTILMKPVDTVWLLLETADTPMHVGVLAVFQKPRNAAPDYLVKLAARMREHKVRTAPWNMRLSGDGVAGVVPRLVEVRDVELNYHFQHSALPEPGGERELGIMVSRLHSPALDRNRPLWELHLIEGLERNRFAFYIKMHHALVSFLDSVPTVLSMLSDSARSRNMPPLWARPLPGDSDDGGEASGALASLASLGRAGVGLLRAAVAPHKAQGFLLPRSAPRSTLNRAINQQRRFATQQFEQARIERVAAATSSTVNDILTYLCGSSLRRFFKEYNALPADSLVGLIPVSLRERGSHNPGNAIAGIRVDLGTDIGDPLARLAAVKESIQAVRDDRATLPAEAVTPYVLMRAAPLFASQLPGLGRFVPPVFNLKISNTHGADEPMYFDGARLDAIYPISQLMQYVALSIDCVSYAGTLNIGFTGARDTLPHLQRLAVYLGQALVDLEQILASAEDAA